MDMDSDQQDPPYAGESVVPAMLCSKLMELAEWVDGQAEWVNEVLQQLNIGEEDLIGSDFFATKSSVDKKDKEGLLYENFVNTVSVYSMACSWDALRQVRIRMDEIRRIFEDKWEDPVRVFQHTKLIQKASMLISIAFLDNEKREAKEQEWEEARNEKFTAHFMSHLRKNFKNQSNTSGEGSQPWPEDWSNPPGE